MQHLGHTLWMAAPGTNLTGVSSRYSLDAIKCNNNCNGHDDSGGSLEIHWKEDSDLGSSVGVL